MKIFTFKNVMFKINPLLLIMSFVWVISGYWKTAIIIYALILTHELAHAIAAMIFSVKFYEIELLPFGASIKMENIFEGHPIKESVIALAGPLVSLIMAVSACAIRVYFPNFIPNELQFLEYYGYLIVVFNLLPVLPLDGGRVFRSIISRKCDFGRATRITSIMGMVLGCIFIAYGVYSFIIARPQLLLSILGVFLVFSAFDHYKNGKFELARCLLNRQKTQFRCESLYVKELAIREDMKLSRIVRLLKDDDKYYIFKVLDKNMQVKGSFDEQLLQSEIMRRKIDCTAGELAG